MKSMYVTLRLNTPDVVALWWIALSNLSTGPTFPEDDRGAGQRYDRTLLAMVKAGYTPTVAETYVV